MDTPEIKNPPVLRPLQFGQASSHVQGQQVAHVPNGRGWGRFFKLMGMRGIKVQ